MYQLKMEQKKRLVTLNTVPGVSVYGERLIKDKEDEYRVWDPFRSKYAAAFLSGMKFLPQIKNQSILYLGVSTGTTPSHFSDILDKGILYGVEFSPKVMRKFYRLAEQRSNLIPILADARRPEEYSSFVLDVDLIYQDVSQPDQAQIFGRNSDEFLKSGGLGVIAIKSQSIDVSLEPEEVFSDQIKQLENDFGLKIIEYSKIDAFEKKHAVIVVKKP
ncbi:MAG: fibrillarin-like rRNA/tRNA 2'-O-methyltransferase [Candidatus Heimdallarchaeota archaeon]|nr:fibrillarin-like rRNA/tRNA 2'-O-methyltransferase [Candidatus Heimdallarchaeota archaeon]